MTITFIPTDHHSFIYFCFPLSPQRCTNKSPLIFRLFFLFFFTSSTYHFQRNNRFFFNHLLSSSSKFPLITLTFCNSSTYRCNCLNSSCLFTPPSSCSHIFILSVCSFQSSFSFLLVIIDLFPSFFPKQFSKHQILYIFLHVFQ